LAQGADRAKFLVYRGVSPLLGKKNIFRPLSKNNTGKAALRAGLPVMSVVSVKSLVFMNVLAL